MWPFTRRPPDPDLKAGFDRLAQAELRLEVIERQVKATVMEWEEWYDKFRRLYVRLAKRVHDANKEAAREEVERATVEEGATDESVGGSSPVAGDGRPAGWERDKSYLRRLAATTARK